MTGIHHCGIGKGDFPCVKARGGIGYTRIADVVPHDYALSWQQSIGRVSILFVWRFVESTGTNFDVDFLNDLEGKPPLLCFHVVSAMFEGLH